MRQYETAFLIAPNLSEEENEKLILQMADIVSRKKGKMIKLERWGKKKLAYLIKKFDEAFYVFFHYEGEPSIPTELERRFKQTEAIIRFLTLKKETKEESQKKKKAVPEERKEVIASEKKKVETAEENQEALIGDETTKEEK